MQNRRHVSYDHYGLREPLNDLDEWGKGIQVPSTYYMIISDNQTSSQREVQRRIDQPITMFYTQNYTIEKQNSTLQDLNITWAKSPKSSSEAEAAENGEEDNQTLAGNNSLESNQLYKQSKTIKTLITAVQPMEI